MVRSGYRHFIGQKCICAYKDCKHGCSSESKKTTDNLDASCGAWLVSRYVLNTNNDEKHGLLPVNNLAATRRINTLLTQQTTQYLTMCERSWQNIRNTAKGHTITTSPRSSNCTSQKSDRNAWAKHIAENSTGKRLLFWASYCPGYWQRSPRVRISATDHSIIWGPQLIRMYGVLSQKCRQGKITSDKRQQSTVVDICPLEWHVLCGPHLCLMWVSIIICTGRSEDTHNHSRCQTVGGNNHHAFRHILLTCKIRIR